MFYLLIFVSDLYLLNPHHSHDICLDLAAPVAVVGVWGVPADGFRLLAHREPPDQARGNRAKNAA